MTKKAKKKCEEKERKKEKKEKEKMEYAQRKPSHLPLAKVQKNTAKEVE